MLSSYPRGKTGVVRANDTDGLVNGNVADPGLVVGKKATTTPPATNPSTGGGGGGSMPWYLMPLLLIGLVRRKLNRRK